MRLLIPQTGLYTYPDVMVVCDKPALVDENGDVLTNPLLIIEVLSESTKDYDRGGKFHQYMRISTLKEYVTISQKDILIDHAVIQPDGGWLLREIGPDALLVRLNSLSLDLKIADIYEGLDFGEAH